MNRRSFLKLLPVASAAVVLPAVAVAANTAPQPNPSDVLPDRWQGDGYYEVQDGPHKKVMFGERWSASDTVHDGPCYRFSPTGPAERQAKVYCYECAMDCFVIQKIRGAYA